MALPRPLWSPVSRNKDAGLGLLPSVFSVPWASICLMSWGNRIVSHMPPGTVLYFEWVPDVLRDARWLTRGRPAFRKMCPISLDMNHEFKLAGPAVGEKFKAGSACRCSGIMQCAKCLRILILFNSRQEADIWNPVFPDEKPETRRG